MEKFEYDAGESSLPAYLASLALRLFRAVDAWNDDNRDPENPCVNLALRAVKSST